MNESTLLQHDCHKECLLGTEYTTFSRSLFLFSSFFWLFLVFFFLIATLCRLKNDLFHRILSLPFTQLHPHFPLFALHIALHLRPNVPNGDHRFSVVSAQAAVVLWLIMVHDEMANKKGVSSFARRYCIVCDEILLW